MVAKTISTSDKTVSRPQIKSLQPFHSLTLRRGFESHMGLPPTHGDESASLRFIDPNWVIDGGMTPPISTPILD